MSDLIERLRAAMGEEEWIARAAGWHRWELRVDKVIATGNGRIVAGNHYHHDATHMVRHDPASVLRKVAGARKILALIEHQLSDDAGDVTAGDMLRGLAEMFGVETPSNLDL